MSQGDGTGQRFDDGGDAFPAGNATDVYRGMTLWDYFAAASMPAAMHLSLVMNARFTEEQLATTAGVIADALIAERKKRFG